MADVSAITANGITYDIKDEVARTEVEKSKILYYPNQTVTTQNTYGQILRIPSSGLDSDITADSVVLDCVFSLPTKIQSRIDWTSYTGFITLNGIVQSSVPVTANVTIGKKKL